MGFPRGWLAKSAVVALLVIGPNHSAQPQPARAAARSGERLLRSYQDTVKVHGRDQARTIEVVYDADAGVALRRTFDANGALIFEQVLGSQPQPSREELDEAFGIIRRDAALGGLARMAHAQLDGGFILDEAEGEPCGPGTRCLQVFMLSESRWGMLRHTAVDLRNGRIAHRSFRRGRKD